MTTDTLIISTAPVFTIDGAANGELARDLLHMKVEEDTEGLKSLIACFRAFGPTGAGAEEDDILYLDGALLDFGKSMEVHMGPSDTPRIIFAGRISGIEGDFKQGREPRVVVYAEDRLMDMRMTRRNRTYEEMTDGDIAEEIAEFHGLTPEIDVEGPTYDRIQQWNMSDLAFLRERARLIRAEIWFQEDSLLFKSRERRNATDLTLVQDNHILELSVTADLAHQRTKVRVFGYDAENRSKIDEQAGEEVLLGEIEGRGLTGPGILGRAFGERESFRVREVPLNDSEAEEWAGAEMKRRGREFVTARGVTRGSPDMIVGSKLTLEGVGAPFEGGGYYVTHVCHRYDLEEGYRTDFTATRATINSGTGVGGG